MFASALAILALRNLDPIIHPVVYTEDGLWAGQILQDGIFQTCLTAKGSYLVVGNILLLGLSLGISFLISGNFLLQLPQSIAIVSYAYFAFVATIAYVASRKFLGRTTSISLYLCILLVPLGTSQNEIFGRISNIGYIVPILLCAILIIRTYSHRTSSRFLADLGCLLCIVTNPFCLIMIPAYIATLVYLELRSTQAIDYKLKFTFFGNALKAVLAKNVLPVTFFLGLAIPLLLGSAQTVTHNVNPFDRGKTGMAVLGRMIAYPFVFPIYTQMNNMASFFFDLVLFAFLTFIFKKSRSFSDRLAIALSFAFFVAYSLATLVFRPLLPYQLGFYGNTFPDRYFMAPNLLIMFAFLISATIPGSSGTAIASKFARLALLAVGIVYFLSLGNLFETDKTRFEIRAAGTLFENLTEFAVTKNGLSSITTSEGWHMLVPERYLPAMPISKGVLSYPLSNARFVNGINVMEKTIVFKNTETNLRLLETARYFSTKSAGARVRSIEIETEFLFVEFDGDVLPFAYPNRLVPGQ